MRKIFVKHDTAEQEYLKAIPWSQKRQWNKKCNEIKELKKYICLQCI